MNKSSRIAAAVATLLAAGAANALTVLSDDFEANTTGLNATPIGWTVSDGTVDIIGNGFFDFVPANGKYIDMDGSTSNAGVLSRSVELMAGTPYVLSFDLAGNRRNAAPEQVNVMFGSAAGSWSLAQSDGFTTYSLALTPLTSGTFTLSFAGVGGDNIGMLLDNVSVTAVPEPQTYAMLALGLLAIGAAVRRRQG
jgi:hypothetical protein